MAKATPQYGRQAIVVLGMHRSGTSALSGIAVALGGQPPATLMEPQPDNPKGFFESSKIADLNDSLLLSAETSWSDWRQVNPNWFSGEQYWRYIPEAVELIKAEFGEGRLIVLKDPRICKLYPFWKSALEAAKYDARHIVIVRSPIEVATSLSVRNGFSILSGLLLWLRHNIEAEYETRRLKRSIVYWPSLVKDWRLTVERVALEAGINWPKRSDAIEIQIDASLDFSLIHHVSDDDQLRSDEHLHLWIVQAHTALLNLSGNTDVEASMVVLDGIRSDFNSSCQLFGPLVASVQQESLVLAKSLGDAQAANRRELNDFDLKVHSMELQLREGIDAIAQHEANIESLQSCVISEMAEKSKLHSEYQQLQHAYAESVDNLSNSTQKLTEADVVFGQLNIDICQKTVEIAQLKLELSEMEQNASADKLADRLEWASLQESNAKYRLEIESMIVQMEYKDKEIFLEKRRTLLSPIISRISRQISNFRKL